MNYQETVEYLYAQLPMFTRVGAIAFKKDLTNTITICNALGNPQTNFKSIHIAGTNGKGSTSHMLASILQEAGYKTGLYTSPHLKDFRERIRINGKLISEYEVVDFVNKHKEIFDAVKPSFFEWTVALAFNCFAEHKVDIAIIETGLGGRLDSTNIINPILSIITNIGWDHMDMLGDTLEKIAVEKAGIIKENTPIIVSEFLPETKSVFVKTAKLKNANLLFTEKEVDLISFQPQNNMVDFTAKIGSNLYKNFTCDLAGNYQKKNIPTVLLAVEQLQYLGYKTSINDVKFGLCRTKQNTGLAGRWQVLNQKPLTITDTAHNVNGIEYVTEQLANLKYTKLHFVLGMVKDKDIKKVLEILPKNAIYYFCKANLPRALNEKDLQAEASNFGLIGETYQTVELAFNAAKNIALPTDLIFIGGSTFVVAEVI